MPSQFLYFIAGAVTFLGFDVSGARADWADGYQNIRQFSLPESSIGIIITNIAWWLLTVLGAIAIIAFVISGIKYLLSAGDEKQAEEAKKAMKYSIIGVMVALAGIVVIRAVDTLLRGGMFF